MFVHKDLGLGGKVEGDLSLDHEQGGYLRDKLDAICYAARLLAQILVVSGQSITRLQMPDLRSLLMTLMSPRTAKVSS